MSRFIEALRSDCRRDRCRGGDHGAGDEVRTRSLQGGNLALFHMSFFRKTPSPSGRVGYGLQRYYWVTTPASEFPWLWGSSPDTHKHITNGSVRLPCEGKNMAAPEPAKGTEAATSKLRVGDRRGNATRDFYARGAVRNRTLEAR